MQPMNALHESILYILNLNEHLNRLVTATGAWSYLILFAIIFAETGLVILPFLPGDALLFAAGSLTAISNLNVYWLIITLTVAAILGNTANYAIGSWIGPRVFHLNKSRFFNPEHLRSAHHFYEKFGGRALIFARFIPIVRTFAPFIAGVARMDYLRYQLFNFIGAICWVGGLISLGHALGNTRVVQEHFSWILIAVIFISLLPALIQFIIGKFRKQ
jgi:membrane-associated protein